jgi:hypothetical protein
VDTSKPLSSQSIKSASVGRVVRAAVMPAHSRSKDGVASLAYVAGIHVLATKQGVDGRDKPGHDGGCFKASGKL